MKYSIITINLNNREGLERTIISVINQTYQDFEYIIIDGGSTDGSVDVIKKYANRINYWVSEPDNGIYHAMNKGVKFAHGEYLNFMNSGDYFIDLEVLNDLLPYLNNDIITGKLISEGKIIGHNKVDVTLMDFFEGTLPHQASFIKKDLLIKRPYKENFKIISDWIFFIETLIFDNCSYKNIERIICYFESNGISSPQNYQLRASEGKQAYNILFPPRILADYIKYQNIESPMLALIPSFNKTYRFHIFICKFVSLIIRIKEIFCK